MKITNFGISFIVSNIKHRQVFHFSKKTSTHKLGRRYALVDENPFFSMEDLIAAQNIS